MLVHNTEQPPIYPNIVRIYSPSPVKNSLYQKMMGWMFLPHICFLEYGIYMQMEVKKSRGRGILKAKKFRYM